MASWLAFGMVFMKTMESKLLPVPKIKVIIRTAGQYRGRHAQTDYCLPLAFAEVGCLAVLVDRDGIQMNKTRGTHCSDTWWKNNRKYVFEVVSAAAQVRGKRGR